MTSAASTDAGLSIRRVQLNPGFARLIVGRDDDRTELDLGSDARLFSIEPGKPAPTLSGEELAVDKVLALFGRAEARDFVDLMALEPRYGLERLCELDDAQYEQLRGDVARWRERTVELQLRNERARGRDLGRER